MKFLSLYSLSPRISLKISHKMFLKPERARRKSRLKGHQLKICLFLLSVIYAEMSKTPVLCSSYSLDKRKLCFSDKILNLSCLVFVRIIFKHTVEIYRDYKISVFFLSMQYFPIVHQQIEFQKITMNIKWYLTEREMVTDIWILNTS